MKCRILGILFLLLLPLCALHADNHTGNTYPTAERLFHIARSANRNLVCYDVNLVHGRVDAKSPIKVYWVNRE